MPVVLGIDLGSSTITALALDADTGAVLASSTRANDAETTTPDDKARGFSEWSAPQTARTAFACLHDIRDDLGPRSAEAAGLGVTGQQHGTVIVDDALRPLTNFIGWQDRRAEQSLPGGNQTFTTNAVALAGVLAPYRTGCRLAAGYAAVTLYWLREMGDLPSVGRACSLTDYFTALATGTRPVTDPTNAAGTGAFNLTAGDWDADVLKALGLPDNLFPEVLPSGHPLGGLTAEAAHLTGLPAGLPVFASVGDNQASFLGAVADRAGSAYVNVGTGGQVSAAVEAFVFDPRLETRPLPGGGYLLVCAGLSGGRAYAALERFYHDAACDLLGVRAEPLYPAMQQLAERVPPGSGGLRCDPYFSGTRQRPELRATFAGLSAENFTPGHLTRALLEGMARAFREGYDAIRPHAPGVRQRLVGGGNGLRDNPLLADILAREFGLPLSVPAHRDEAAFGAALLAGVASGAFPNWKAAATVIHYQPQSLMPDKLGNAQYTPN